MSFLYLVCQENSDEFDGDSIQGHILKYQIFDLKDSLDVRF